MRYLGISMIKKCQNHSFLILRNISFDFRIFPVKGFIIISCIKHLQEQESKDFSCPFELLRLKICWIFLPLFNSKLIYTTILTMSIASFTIAKLDKNLRYMQSQRNRPNCETVKVRDTYAELNICKTFWSVSNGFENCVCYQ